MARSTRASREALYNRVKKKIERLSPIDEVSMSMKKAAEEVLSIHTIGSEGPPEEITSMLSNLLLSSRRTFIPKYFSNPSYPTLLLKEVAALYGCFDIPSSTLEQLDEETTSDHVALTHNWLACAYSPTMQFVNRLLRMYKTSTSLDAPFGEYIPIAQHTVGENEQQAKEQTSQRQNPYQGP